MHKTKKRVCQKSMTHPLFIFRNVSAFQRFTKIYSTCTVEITQYALKGQKLLAQGIALGNYEHKPVALKGQKLYNTSQPNPGTRNFHHIPHYIFSRTLYIPLQTNAWCDALSDWQCIVMFYLQLIG